MRSNNNHETITHLAMPQRQIPVLIDAGSGPAEGYMPSPFANGKSVMRVRRILPEFVKSLKSPKRKKEIEKEYGAIEAEEWQRFREMLTFIDRLNAGDWSPIIDFDMKALESLPALLDSASPEGWLPDESESTAGVLSYKSASGDGKRLKVKIGELSLRSVEDASVPPKSVDRLTHKPSRDDGPTEWSVMISTEVKTAALALSEAFTAGLSKTRFVVWWTDVGRKLVPGLYCPDILTALYASVLSTIGTPGGLAVCQRCGEHFIRSRAKQLYCDHKCQVAAAMKRHRKNLKLKAETAPKGPKQKTKNVRGGRS
jgi:hypothetical protein